jgi:hypothetical protein
MVLFIILMAKEDGNMTRQKVTDPALLAQLGESPRQKVTDPKLLAQLNSDEENQEDEGAYLDKLPGQQGFLSKLPRNIMIGLAHAGRNLHNLPHDLVQGFEQGTQGFGKQLSALPGSIQVNSKPLSERLPYDERDFSQAFGQQGDPTMMDSLIQKGLEYAPEIAGAGGLIRGGVRRLKGTHQLDKAAKLINQSGQSNFNYSPAMIRDAKKFLPKTEATKELLGAVSKGDYKSAFKLQSQIGHHQRKLEKSLLASENSIMAPKAAELKQSMLGHLEKVLRDSNKIEEADLLRGGINNYRQYKKVMEAAKPIVKYLGIPTTILAGIPFAYKKTKEFIGD